MCAENSSAMAPVYMFEKITKYTKVIFGTGNAGPSDLCCGHTALLILNISGTHVCTTRILHMC